VLLTVLRRIGPSEIAMIHEGVEWPAFDKATTRCARRCRTWLSPAGVIRTEPKRGEEG
jgi:hypothetical protein